LNRACKLQCFQPHQARPLDARRSSRRRPLRRDDLLPVPEGPLARSQW
jgi:hypothetical protein